MRSRLSKLINDGLAFTSVSLARLCIASVQTSSSPLHSLLCGHTRSLLKQTRRTMSSSGPKVYRPSRITAVALLLNPFVTGTLFWNLTRARPAVKARTGYGALLKLLKALLVLGALKRISARLDSIALNHWRFRTDRSRWNWTEEVAVVTGGCSGFGLLVTERLLRRGVKVAVVDVAPLPDRLAVRK